ncbi:MAG: hypothetical protein GX644_03425, partial [Limnobacter sp.]|nr:hypothetical protein [Limnobacter sp.]
MPRSPEDLLELLAAHLGSADVPRRRRPDAEGIGFDLTDPARLLDLDHPELRARLEATLARDPVAPEVALRAELRAFAGGDFELALGAAPETLRGAVVAQAR